MRDPAVETIRAMGAEIERLRAAADDDVEQLEAYGREHGLAALLNHLGLDGFGNEVVAKDAEIAELRNALDERGWGADA